MHSFEFLCLLRIQNTGNAIIGLLLHSVRSAEPIEGRERVVFTDIERFGLTSLEDDFHHTLLSGIQIETLRELLKLIVNGRSAMKATRGLRRARLDLSASVRMHPNTDRQGYAKEKRSTRGTKDHSLDGGTIWQCHLACSIFNHSTSIPSA